MTDFNSDPAVRRFARQMRSMVLMMHLENVVVKW